ELREQPLDRCADLIGKLLYRDFRHRVRPSLTGLRNRLARRLLDLLILEPYLARRHDDGRRFFVIETADLSQFPSREIGEILATGHLGTGKLRREFAAHAFDLEEI